MTRTPPDFPRPFEAMDKRTLKQLLPKDVPFLGLSSNSSINAAYSLFNEGYFFTNRFICLSKGGMVSTLYFIEQFSGRACLFFSLLYQIDRINGFFEFTQ